MAKVKIEKVIDIVDSDMRKALSETLKKHFPNENFNDREVFKTFKRMVSRKCDTWVNVPDCFVDKE